MTDDLPLVPPARLGALLTDHRTRRGLTIDELVVATEIPFSTDELRRIEQGQMPLSDDQVHRLMHAYQAQSGPVVPERSELIVDLEHGALLAGRKTRVLPEDATFDEILGRYLSLLYLMRGIEPGRKLALRGDDLEVLSGALERNIAEIEGRLFELMMPGEVGPWLNRVRHRLAIPAAGILVGLTTVGSLVFVQFPKGERASVGGGGDAAGTGATSGATDIALAANVVIGDAELAPAVAVARPDADARPSVYTPGDPASVGAAAEALIGYDYRRVLDGWTFEFEGPRDGYRGNTNTVSRTISVYVGEHDTPEVVAEVVAHEVGHALDVMYLDDATRIEWMEMRDVTEGWWPHSGASDFHVGAGDYAEAVARLLVDSPSDSEYGTFTAVELDFVAATLPSAG
ncbi:MAG: helix-turn-helix transcriptional regulator [Actinomycetota bacterium]